MSGFEDIPEQPEDIRARPIAWTLGASVLVIVTCAVIVWALRVFELEGGGESQVRRVELVPPSRPFSGMPSIEHVRRTSHDQMDEWSWADRAAQRVRLPVDIAIDRYLAHYNDQRGDR